MARYDYGMRGQWGRAGPRDMEPGHYHRGAGYARPWPWAPPSRHVTARYNMDYVRPEDEPRHRFNPNPFGGDARSRMGDERSYGRPYMTRGGTWTYRGTPEPIRYDYRDFGPEYGGRYPDEI